MRLDVLVLLFSFCLFSGSSKAEDSDKKQSAGVLAEGSYSGLYNRGDWVHWIDANGDCQNTRAEILIRESKNRVTLTRNGCSVLFGRWVDRYTGKQWTSASHLDIDHIVPLAWANGHGGSKWPKERKNFSLMI